MNQPQAILFPGQGAQFAGMGRDFADAFAIAREIWQEADQVLGFSLSDSCWNRGEEVNRTDIAQPGIYTTSVSVIRVLETRGLDRSKLAFTAGLSLGEYTALWCAGSISFADGLRLVRLRGEAMQRASEQIRSSMTSLMGATEDQARALAAQASQAGICQVANLNAPGQVILSGELAALDFAEAAAKDFGIRRTRRLVVAGGFHSECMRPAAQALAMALREIEIRSPRVPFVSNVNAVFSTDPQAIREQLAAQVCASVLWEQSMRLALSQGIRSFLEPAPGEVLGGLLRKIEEGVEIQSVARPEQVPAA
ncbi:MAG: ACP S-malonyltransferase [Planctomycetia bacterium]